MKGITVNSYTEIERAILDEGTNVSYGNFSILQSTTTGNIIIQRMNDNGRVVETSIGNKYEAISLFMTLTERSREKHSGIRVLSLFDGIATGRLALEELGIEVAEYHAFEIDKRAISVAKFNWPDIIEHGDVTKIDYEEFKNIDLVIAGSPCQDFSQMNPNRQGLNGEKSCLIKYFFRTLYCCHPKYYFLENVAHMPKKDMSIISYTVGVGPQFVDSHVVSAQTRPRAYWTNLGGYIPCGLHAPHAQDILLSGIAPRDTYTAVLTTRSPKNEKTLLRKAQQGYFYNVALEPDEQGTYVHSIDPELTRRFYRAEPGKRYRVRLLEPIELERLQTLPDNYTKYSVNESWPTVGTAARVKMIGNCWTNKVIQGFFKNLLVK